MYDQSQNLPRPNVFAWACIVIAIIRTVAYFC